MNEKVAEEKTWRDWALRAVALVGLLAILILGAWGIIQLAFGLTDILGGIGNSVSSLFESQPAPAQTQSATTTPAEAVSVMTPSLADSAQPFTLSWTHTGGSGDYAYQISYACVDGLSIKAPLPTGGMQAVPCNTPFNYTSATQSLTLTPELTGVKQVSAVFTVAAQQLSSNIVTSSGSATMTILPLASVTGTYSNTTTSTTSAVPTTKYVPATKVARTLYGLPDLAATIVAATPTTGGYSVEFLIRNVGTNTASAGWVFAASVPTSALNTSSTGYNYQSQGQPALYPGASILYTIRFSTPNNNSYYTGYNSPSYQQQTCGYKQDYTYTGYADYPNGYSYTCPSYSNPTYSYPTSYTNNQTFTVTVDPSGYLTESSRADNTASVTLSY